MPYQRRVISSFTFEETELTILKYLSEGKPVKEIASLMKRKYGTIARIISIMLFELDARNNTHLIATAYQKGLLKLKEDVHK